FEVNLVNGTYAVTTTLGDAEYARDNMSIYFNGTLMASGLSTRAGQFIQPTFAMQVSNSMLNVRDVGGIANPNFAVDAIDINSDPPVTANAGPAQTANEGSAVTFAGSASGGTGNLVYAWNFGDGSTASGTLSPTHTYGNSGTYIATLTVTDGYGLSQT